MSWISLIILLFVSICKSNDVPVIGILTVPCLPSIAASDCPSWVGFEAKSYIAASYVKFLEAGGAKVVPILSTDTLENVSKLVLQLNGVLFTGGTEYFNSTSIYFNQIKNILATMRKYHFDNPTKSIPLWSTCLGFHGLIVAVAKAGTSIFKGGYDAINTPFKVDFTSYGSKSRMFNSTMPPVYSIAVYNKMSTEAITLNDHSVSCDPTDFANDEYLYGNFSNIGNSLSSNNKNFVTLIESQTNIGLSWYGSQFHPEKPQYEFAVNGIPHNLDAIFANQYLAEFFVNECRVRNDIEMSSATLNDIVIYNDIPYYVDKNGGSGFEQNYLFK